jgi:tetratricopeptide (TPR) repeat protein
VLAVAMTAVVLLGAIAYGVHRAVLWNGPRELKLCIATDFGFRSGAPNWQDRVRLWLAETNRAFEGSEVIWTIAGFGEMAPNVTEGSLDQRRTALTDAPPCGGDVVLGLSANPDRQSNSSVSPFGRTAFVAISRTDSDAIAVIVLSRTLASLFGVSIDARTVVQTDNPEAAVLDAPSLELVRSLRRYDFSKGLVALTPEWERRAADALAKYLDNGRLPRKAAAHRALALAYADGLRHSASSAHFERAVQAAPDVATLRVEWAMELRADARTEEAIAQLRKAMQLEPENARTYALAGVIFWNAKRIEESIHEMRIATRLEPRNATYQAILGQALSARIGHTEEAAAAFEAALRLNPNEPAAGAGLEFVRMMRGGARLVLSEFEAEVGKNPASAEAHRRLGAALIAAGNNDQAEKSLRHAVQLDPTSGSARLALAKLYYVSRDYSRAYEELQAAIKLGAYPGGAWADAIKRQIETR